MVSQGSPEAWIRRYHPAPQPAFRLACMPHAGGSANAFHPLSALLGPQGEVLAVQYPGRLDRWAEPPLNSIPEFADEVTRALLAWTGVPLALFGHSMGATIAFEVARRLEAASVPVVRLFASGRPAPSIHRPETLPAGDDESLLRELSDLGGTDAAVLASPELLSMVMPALRADYRAVADYSCGPEVRIAAPITALWGRDDPRASRSDALAWERHTTGDFDRREFAGGHFYLADQTVAVADVVLDRIAVIDGEPTTDS